MRATGSVKRSSAPRSAWALHAPEPRLGRRLLAVLLLVALMAGLFVGLQRWLRPQAERVLLSSTESSPFLGLLVSQTANWQTLHFEISDVAAGERALAANEALGQVVFPRGFFQATAAGTEREALELRLNPQRPFEAARFLQFLQPILDGLGTGQASMFAAYELEEQAGVAPDEAVARLNQRALRLIGALLERDHLVDQPATAATVAGPFRLAGLLLLALALLLRQARLLRERDWGLLGRLAASRLLRAHFGQSLLPALLLGLCLVLADHLLCGSPLWAAGPAWAVLFVGLWLVLMPLWRRRGQGWTCLSASFLYLLLYVLSLGYFWDLARLPDAIWSFYRFYPPLQALDLLQSAGPWWRALALTLVPLVAAVFGGRLEEGLALGRGALSRKAVVQGSGALGRAKAAQAVPQPPTLWHLVLRTLVANGRTFLLLALLPPLLILGQNVYERSTQPRPLRLSVVGPLAKGEQDFWTRAFADTDLHFVADRATALRALERGDTDAVFSLPASPAEAAAVAGQQGAASKMTQASPNLATRLRELRLRASDERLQGSLASQFLAARYSRELGDELAAEGIARERYLAACAQRLATRDRWTTTISGLSPEAREQRLPDYGLELFVLALLALWVAAEVEPAALGERLRPVPYRGWRYSALQVLAWTLAAALQEVLFALLMRWQKDLSLALGMLALLWLSFVLRLLILRLLLRYCPRCPFGLWALLTLADGLCGGAFGALPSAWQAGPGLLWPMTWLLRALGH